jgi:hypothetical protein
MGFIRGFAPRRQVLDYASNFSILTDSDPLRQRLAVADRVSFVPFELYRNPPGVWQVLDWLLTGKTNVKPKKTLTGYSTRSGQHHGLSLGTGEGMVEPLSTYLICFQT